MMKNSNLSGNIKNILLFSLAVLVFGCSSISDPQELHARLQRERELSHGIEAAWDLLLDNQFTQAKKIFEESQDEEFTQLGALRGQGISEFALYGNYEAFEALLHSIENNPQAPQSLAAAHFLQENLLYTNNLYKEYISLIESIIANKNTPDWLKQEYNFILFDYYHNYINDQSKSLELMDQMELLRDWRLLGPFSNISGSGYQNDYIDVEEGFSSDVINGAMNNWPLSPFTPPLEYGEISIPLSQYFGNRPFSSIYAQKNFSVEDPGLYNMVFSHEGSIEVWIDGEKILENEDYQGGSNRFHINRQLEEGNHVILVKCGSREGNSSFALSFHKMEEHDNSASSFYREFFPNENIYDPFIDALINEFKGKQNADSLLWLSYSLMRKGWMTESRLFLDQLEEMNPDSMITIWLQAHYDQLSGDEISYNQKMLSLNNMEIDFAPASSFAIKNFIENSRRDAAEELLKDLNNRYPDWYYGLEGEMRFSLWMEKENAFNLYSQLIFHNPDLSAPSLALLEYSYQLQYETSIEAVDRLYSLGYYRKTLFWDYFLSSLFGHQNRARNRLKHYLTYYPINEYLWTEYLSFLYQDDETSFLSIQNQTHDLIRTFPLSYNLLTDYVELCSYYYEAAQHTIDHLSAKREYTDALAQLLQYYPDNLHMRDQLRSLEGEKEFFDELSRREPYSLIEEFQNSDFPYWNSHAIIVNDDRKEIFFNDGASTIMQQWIVKVLSPQGVSQNRFFDLEFNPANSLETAYLLKEDGTRIEAEIANRTLAFPGLEAGDYIVIQYHGELYRTGSLNDQIWTSTTLQSYYPIYLKDFQLIYPEDTDIQIRYNNVEEPQEELENDGFIEGFEMQHFHGENIDALDFSFYSQSWQDVSPWVDFSTLESWSSIIDWYQNLYQGQCDVTPSIEQKVEELCQGLNQPYDIIREIFDYVSNKIEYEDLSFQYSGFVPQTAQSIYDEGYGDCKDQSVLLISMLQAAGIDSYMVLNSPNYRGDHPYLPSTRFTHAIVAVPLDDRILYLDPTSTYYTFDELPASMVGSYILPIIDQGEFQRLESGITEQKTYFLIELDNINSTTDVRASLSYQGYPAGSLRYQFSGLNDQDRFDQYSLNINSWMPGLILTALEMENIENLHYDPQIRFEGEIPRMIKSIDSRLSHLALPWLEVFDLEQRARMGLLTQNEALYISDSQWLTPTVQSFVIEIPFGYVLHRLPLNARYTFNGSYIDYQFTENGDKIICTREVFLPTQIVHPQELTSYQQFIGNALAKEQEEIYFTSNNSYFD